MRQPAVATTIVGATTVEQLKVNLAASELGLDADALQVLDTASRRRLGFPYRLSSDSSPQPARNRSPTIASSRVLSMRIRLRQGFSPGGVGEVGLVHQAA